MVRSDVGGGPVLWLSFGDVSNQKDSQTYFVVIRPVDYIAPLPGIVCRGFNSSRTSGKKQTATLFLKLHVSTQLETSLPTSWSSFGRLKEADRRVGISRCVLQTREQHQTKPTRCCRTRCTMSGPQISMITQKTHRKHSGSSVMSGSS